MIKNETRKIKNKKLLFTYTIKKEVKRFSVEHINFKQTFKYYVQKKIPFVITEFNMNKNHFKLSNLINLYRDNQVQFYDPKKEKAYFYDKFKIIMDDTRYINNIGRWSTTNNNKHLKLNDIRSLIIQSRYPKGSCFSTQLFILSSKGSGTSFHNADADNFFHVAR